MTWLYFLCWEMHTFISIPLLCLNNSIQMLPSLESPTEYSYPFSRQPKCMISCSPFLYSPVEESLWLSNMLPVYLIVCNHCFFLFTLPKWEFSSLRVETMSLDYLLALHIGRCLAWGSFQLRFVGWILNKNQFKKNVVWW